MLGLVTGLVTALLLFIGEESSSGVAQGWRRRGLRQLVVNVNSGSAEGASVEAAKPARTLQRRGRGGDAGVGGTVWCRRQCAVPSWGRCIARAPARASAGEAVRRKKSRLALCVATPIYSEVGAAMMGHFKVNGVGTLWLPGNNEVMAKDVGAVMIVWEL